MHVARPLAVLLFCTTMPALAQSASSSLNLKLPPEPSPAQVNSVSGSKPEPATAASTAQATQATPVAPMLPGPYAETYGTRRDAQQNGCDDAAYAKPQVHGSVGMGVAAGNHVSGNYQTGTIATTKALGSCDDPKGIVGASISVSKESINYRRGSRP